MATGQTRVSVVFPASARSDHVDIAANLAAVLACGGRRVLVVDFAGGDRRVRDYLSVFPAEVTACPDRLRIAVREITADRSAVLGEVRRFDLPGDQVGAVSSLNVGATQQRLDLARADPEAVAALRSRLLDSGYDDVLVVLPETDAGARAETMAGILADAVLLAFGPSERAVARAVDVAARIRKATPIQVDVLPVLARVPATDRSSPLIARVRSDANGMFAVLFAEQAERVPNQSCAELPLMAYAESSPILSVVAEDAGTPLWREYARLATWLTGRVGWLAMAPHIRAGYRWSCGLDSDPDTRPVVIADLPGTREWVPWVRTQIIRAGGTVVDAADAPPGVPVLLLHRDDEDEFAVPAEAGAPEATLVPVAVPDRDDDGGPDAFAGAASQAEAFRTRLLSALGFVGPSRFPERAPTRFPWSTPMNRHLPVTGDLPGVDDPDLAALRAALVLPTGRRTIALVHGGAGTGKSTLARAYAEHYAWDYQGVWWLSSRDRRSLLQSVAALAEVVLPGDSVARQYGSTRSLTAVTAPRNCRFLLVYDGCDDLDVLADGLLPAEDGDVHVLVTSRAPSGSVPIDHQIELTALRPEQSVARLTERVPDLNPAAAAEVGAALGHRPLAVRLAGAWLDEAGARLREAGHDAVSAARTAQAELLAALAERDGDDPVSAIVAVVVDTLLSPELDAATGGTGLGEVTVLLARCFTALASNGIGLEFIQSRELVGALAGRLGRAAPRLLVDTADIDRALRLGERYGLLTVDWGLSGVVRVNRAITAALIALAEPEEAAAIAAMVLSALAEFAPTESAPESLRHRFRLLIWHVEPSGALHSTDDQVRRWLVNQVRYLYEQDIKAISEETLVHGERLLAAWEQAGIPADDPLRLRLIVQLANLARALGDRDRARKLDVEALDLQSDVHQAPTPAALAAARGLGGDDRGLGRYLDALATDQLVWAGKVRELGEDHPQTRSAANNLATSLYLSGNTQRALAVERQNHSRVVRLFGEHHERTDWSAVRIATYQRDLGLGDSRARLANLVSALRGRPGRERLTLIAQWQWSMELRDTGELRTATTIITEALDGFRALLPDGHPDITAAMLTSASITRRSGHLPGQAEEMAQAAVARLDHRDFDEAHPIRALAGLGLGLATAAAGDHAAGTEAVARAYDSLLSRFDRAHPWSLAAAIDLAVLHASAGDLATAASLTEEALEDLLDTVGPTHPYVAIAGHNLGLAREGAQRTWREIDVDIPHT
ncbi:FxSxx-COOH system tetratricopeptide repeat protein [Actinokineospora fastidiosa]|uniref:NTPase n=1 Tax=Actinokineospora fastidiosa TaxID=1816 RepID=A0A918LIE7_9PSEU|nr:FxSxx-COOH system tetratricopeptide repeat protein [Actinokineospora fastidiosa]GGS52115.1 NTPase [Actinokineospora fastidiosa]